MNHNDLCETDGPLPDGTNHFDVNNCPGDYDIFQCVKGMLILRVFAVQNLSLNDFLP